LLNPGHPGGDERAEGDDDMRTTRSQGKTGRKKRTSDEEPLQVRTALKAGEASVNHNDGLVVRTMPALRAESQYEVAVMGGGGIIDLDTHPEPYVTMSDLADYWRVSRKQVYRQIETGMLKATVLGPMLRICTADAIRFEEMAAMPPAGRERALHRGNGSVIINAAASSAASSGGGRKR
jgi:hypothetical protein